MNIWMATSFSLFVIGALGVLLGHIFDEDALGGWGGLMGLLGLISMILCALSFMWIAVLE